MKRVKRLFGDLIAAAISLLILASAFALPFETVKAAPTAVGPAPYSEPCKGAGRIASCMIPEKVHDSVASDSPESEADKIPLEMGPEPISPGDAGTQNFTNEDVKETETEFAEDIYVPDTEAETGGESPHPSPAVTPVSSADSVGRGSDSPPDCHSLPRQALRYPQGEGFTQGEGPVEVIPEREDPPATELDALIREAAERYGLPWELVSAVCWAESTYNPYAVSSTPDYGLMQVTQSVMGSYGLTADNWMDPAANLDAGCRILREKLDLSGGDAAAALTRYRFGDAEALAMWSRGEWSNWYNERVLGKYYEILREG